MLVTTGAIFGTLAVISVALEAPGPAMAFSAISAWLISHG
jgi:hypothetical protein